VHKKSNPESVVTKSAYLLFYRRRSAGPLGSPQLQQVVNAWWNPGFEGAEDSDEPNSRTASPAGNGLRLDGSSRNGSSSAFAAGAGAGVRREAGSGGVGNLATKEAGAGTLEDELPNYNEHDDEGYGAGDEDVPGTNMDTFYGPLTNNSYGYHAPVWSFDSITQNDGTDDVFDDGASSNAPNLASESLDDRLLEDFGDELGDVVHHPGMGTPIGGVAGGLDDLPDEDDDDVVDIHVSRED
jgi:ubiquitin carboxyl-terminal hydrolase 4/11/15